MTLKLTTKSKPSDANTAETIFAKLVDNTTDLKRRKMFLARTCMDDNSINNEVVAHILHSAAKGDVESVYHAKKLQLDEIIQSLEDGPVRSAMYVGTSAQNNGSSVRRVQVMLDNGDSAYPIVTSNELAQSLQCGDTVLLDGQVRTVLVRVATVHTGELAELKGRIDADRIELSLHDHSDEVYRVAAGLKAKLDNNEVQPGDRLVVCHRRRMAFEVLPPRDGPSHYRFLVKTPVPDIQAERDIGCPPPFIQELLSHMRREMLNPQLGRRYRRRPIQSRLLSGVSGTGKTLSTLALIRATYELIREVTGAPLESIPPRVLQLRASEVLSMWLGESDKNMDRFFDEASRLASEPFVGPDGREWTLPVICRAEEIDALARARGTSDAVYDRIQTTILDRLDHLSKDLGNKLIIFVFTTNVPQACDVAFLRRAGGEIVVFGRVGRPQFAAILTKTLRGLPIRSDHGADSREAQRRVCRDVTNWLFSPNGNDPGQLEITYAGSSTPVVKQRRDLLTGAVVDRAVQQAADEACRLEEQGVEAPGLSTQMLISALDQQVRAICDQVNEMNVHNYVTLPDGVRVASVRRIRQPAVQAFELDRSHA